MKMKSRRSYLPSKYNEEPPRPSWLYLDALSRCTLLPLISNTMHTVLQEESDEDTSECSFSDPLQKFLSCLISYTSKESMKGLKHHGKLTFLFKLECTSTSCSLASLLLMYRITLNNGGGKHTGFTIMPSSCDKKDLAKVKASISVDGSKLLLDFPRHCPLGGVTEVSETADNHFQLLSFQYFGPDCMVPFLFEVELPWVVTGNISAPALIYYQCKTRLVVNLILAETKRGKPLDT
jgi:hypothetical protein